MRTSHRPSEQMAELPGLVQIMLLGTTNLRLNKQSLPLSQGSKAENLLIHLTLAQGRRLPRAHLLNYLWPEQELPLAAQSLNSLVYRLNTHFKQTRHAVQLVGYDDGYYFLHAEQVAVDIDYFEQWQQQGKRQLARGEAEQGITYYEQALALYRGDLCSEANVGSFQLTIERERLRCLYLDLLAQLADHYLPANPMQALTYIYSLLNHDPCREDAHRQAMRCYMKLGVRAQALRQYQFCCQALATEYGAQPEPATQQLFEQIRLHPEGLQLA